MISKKMNNQGESMKINVLRIALCASMLLGIGCAQALSLDDIKKIMGLLGQTGQVMFDSKTGVIQDIEKLNLSMTQLRAFSQCVPLAMKENKEVADLVIPLKKADGTVIAKVACRDFTIPVGSIQAVLSLLNTKVLGDKDHPGILEAVLEILKILGVNQVEPVQGVAGDVNLVLTQIDQVLEKLKTTLTVKSVGEESATNSDITETTTTKPKETTSIIPKEITASKTDVTITKKDEKKEDPSISQTISSVLNDLLALAKVALTIPGAVGDIKSSVENVKDITPCIKSMTDECKKLCTDRETCTAYALNDAARILRPSIQVLLGSIQTKTVDGKTTQAYVPGVLGTSLIILDKVIKLVSDKLKNQVSVGPYAKQFSQKLTALQKSFATLVQGLNLSVNWLQALSVQLAPNAGLPEGPGGIKLPPVKSTDKN